MSLRKNLLGISGIILASGMVAIAQHPQTPTTTTDGTLKRERLERREKLRDRVEGMRRHGGPEGLGRRGPGHGNLMRGIDLTEAQREQIRAITQRRHEGAKAQREELFKLREKRTAGTFSANDETRAKVLRQEIRAAMESIRTETEGILTAEQKSRIGELQKERKAMHEQRMKERQELRNKPQ